MSFEKIPNWVRWPLSVIAFWATIILLPFILQFLNVITPYTMEPGTLTFLFFAVSVQPVSCYLACLAAYTMAPKKKFEIPLVNSIIAVCIVAINEYLAILYVASFESHTSNVLSVFAIVFSLLFCYRKSKGGD